MKDRECTYCYHGKMTSKVTQEGKYAVDTYLEPNEKIALVITHRGGRYKDWMYLDFLFCPMCGRELTVKKTKGNKE